jgi:hypothetical protein
MQIKLKLKDFLLIIFSLSTILTLASSSFVNATTSTNLQSILDDTPYYEPSLSSSCGTGAITVALTGDNNAQKAFNYFVSQGLSQEQAAGILGNMQAESSVQPQRLEGTASGIITPSSSLSISQLTDDTLGWGIVQWTPPGVIITQVDQANGDPDDLGTQLSFVWQELNSNDIYALDQLKMTSTPEAAADSFEQYFERPASLGDEPIREAFAEAFYQQFVNNVSLPPSLDTSVSSTAGDCAAAAASSATGYENPLRSVQGLTPLRIDQGVDYEGTGPIYSLGDGIVISINTTQSGWPGLGSNCDDGPSSCNGAFIKYQLTAGPANGDYVYFAEDCKPVATVGEVLTSSTVICNMYEGGTNVETGWTTSADGEAALASDQYQANGGGNYATTAGQNFSALLQSLGAPAGVIDGDMGPSILSGYPTW